MLFVIAALSYVAYMAAGFGVAGLIANALDEDAHFLTVLLWPVAVAFFIGGFVYGLLRRS